MEMFWIFCRLYRCASTGTERLYIYGIDSVNETAVCEAFTYLSECEKETACKEMAKGIWYTTASVSRIWKVNKW